MMYTTTIPIKPVPKARPRVSNGRAYTPQRTKQFERDVAVMVRSTMMKNCQKPIEGSVYVAITFNFKTPNADFVGCSNYTTTSDVDNLIKAVLDALNGVAYNDDRQVVQVTGWKRWDVSDSVIVTVSDEPFLISVKN